MRAVEEKEEKSLSTQTLQGLNWHVLASLIRFVAHFGIGIVLARLLPPEDFGIVGLAHIATGFASTLANLGLGPALIQQKEVTERHVRVAHTISLAASAAAAAALYTSAGLIADFFNDARVAPVLRALSITFVFTGFSIAAGALLTRRLAFNVLVKIDLFASVIGFGGVAVGMAALGYGYWSLVGGTLVQTALSTILKYAAVRHTVRPLAARSELRDLFTFSAGMSLEGTVNYFARQGDYFVVGRMMSATSLGYYSRAYSLMQLPLTFLGSALSRVLFPAASKIQDDRERFRRAYLTTFSLSVAISLPISLGMAVLAPELILTLYGERWAPTIPLFQILAVFGMFRMSYNNTAAFIHARGRTFGLVMSQIVYGVLVIGGSFWAIMHWGLAGVAWTVGGSIFAMWLMVVGMANRAAAIGLRAFVRAFVGAICPGIVVGVFLLALAMGLRGARISSPLILLIAGTAFAIVTMATLYYQARRLRHPAIDTQLNRVAGAVARARARFG